MTPTEDIEKIRKEVLPRLVKVMVIQSFAIGLLVIGMIFLGYLAATRKPIIHAITESGRIIPLVPLDQPYVGDPRIVGFSDECIRQAFSHDFLNFRASLSDSKRCFTSSGADGFDAAITPLIEDIKKRRLVMTATLEPAVIVKSYKSKGVATWVVQTKMTLFREGTSERVPPASFVLDLVVERVPLEESVRGVGIAQINVRPGAV